MKLRTILNMSAVIVISSVMVTQNGFSQTQTATDGSDGFCSKNIELFLDRNSFDSLPVTSISVTISQMLKDHEARTGMTLKGIFQAPVRRLGEPPIETHYSLLRLGKASDFPNGEKALLLQNPVHQKIDLVVNPRHLRSVNPEYQLYLIVQDFVANRDCVSRH